jgi:hypothetical protein
MPAGMKSQPQLFEEFSSTYPVVSAAEIDDRLQRLLGGVRAPFYSSVQFTSRIVLHECRYEHRRQMGKMRLLGGCCMRY